MTEKTAMNWENAVQWLRSQPAFQTMARDCFYDDPLFAAALRYESSAEWAAVRKLLPKQPGRALDIGAGRGISSFALARDGWSVTALEPDASKIVGAGAIEDLSHEANLAIVVVQEWGESLPFADGSFDLVYCRAALHHARDLDQLCREIGRVLKPGGMFLATREHVISRKEDLPAFLAAHPLHHLYGGENAYLLSDYQRAIRNGGVRIERTLSPSQSDLNLFPATKLDIKRGWARKFNFPFPVIIPDALLTMWDKVSSEPGRLYSFVGLKP